MARAGGGMSALAAIETRIAEAECEACRTDPTLRCSDCSTWVCSRCTEILTRVDWDPRVHVTKCAECQVDVCADNLRFGLCPPCREAAVRS